MRAPTVARLIERDNALSVESKSILCHFLLFETLFVTSAPSAVSPLETLQRFNAAKPNFPRKGSKNFTQYFSERPEMTTQ
jgi:hypothetical protein